GEEVRPAALLAVSGPGLTRRCMSSAAPRQHEVIDQIVADLCPDLLARDRIEVEVDTAVDAAAGLLVGDSPEARIRACPARCPFPVRFEGNVVRPEEARPHRGAARAEGGGGA